MALLAARVETRGHRFRIRCRYEVTAVRLPETSRGATRHREGVLGGLMGTFGPKRARLRDR